MKAVQDADSKGMSEVKPDHTFFLRFSLGQFFFITSYFHLINYLFDMGGGDEEKTPERKPRHTERAMCGEECIGSSTTTHHSNFQSSVPYYPTIVPLYH